MIQDFDLTDTTEQSDDLKQELKFYKNAIAGANVGIWEWNIKTGEQIINERWAEILGYTVGELAPINIETFRNLIHPLDLADVDYKINFYSIQKGHYTISFRMKHKDDRWIYIESSGRVTSWTPEGEPLVMSGCHIDITKRKLAEQAVEENERRLKATQEIAHIGNWELDLKTGFVWASDEAARIYGLELTPNNMLDFSIAQKMVKEEHRQRMDESLYHLLHGGRTYDIEFSIINGFTNEEIMIHSKAILEKDGQGDPVRVIGTIQDITEEKKREDELTYLVNHDLLTGLYNRRFFNEELKRLDGADTYPLALVLCDVNGLKIINDSFGPELGDKVLKRVAEVLQSGAWRTGIVARTGGDEFSLLLPKTGINVVLREIKQLKDQLLKEKVGGFDISLSFGAAAKANPDQNIREVIKIAEDRMHRQKLYENRSARNKSVDLIINTLYEKNNREMLHSRRVSQLCEAFATWLGRSKDEINRIRIAGLMHDIGKIGIDEKILNKSDKLTGEEWEEIKKHSEIGYRILSSVAEFSEVADYVLAHQEKWDGTGYPKGLKEDSIPVEARIIALADSYDAMTGLRTYGQVHTKEDALLEIKSCAGTHFAPALAASFIDMMKSNKKSSL